MEQRSNNKYFHIQSFINSSRELQMQADGFLFVPPLQSTSDSHARWIGGKVKQLFRRCPHAFTFLSLTAWGAWKKVGLMLFSNVDWGVR
jgi:hypothetical protein